MFFYVGDDCPLKLNQVEPQLFLDDGWNHKDNIWYKGYSTECVLADNLLAIIDGWQPAGKYCVIYNKVIYHPILRGFPLYSNDTSVTNLKLAGYYPVVYETRSPPTDQSSLSIDEASVLIGDILVENTRNFYQFNDVDDMTVLFSAGLDTLTAWAVIDQVTKNYTLSYHVPNKNDKTLLDLLGTKRDYTSELIDHVSKEYWGYHHACFYREQNWNITGYYAEVYTYRDGAAINAIANYYGKRIDQFAKESDYLYKFLKRTTVIDTFKNSHMVFGDETELKNFLWSTIWYDHQMWHLDNNLMFSPFADIRIPSIVHRLSVEDIGSNSVSGQIQRNIVDRFRPDIACLLSDYKNEGPVWDNFNLHFETVIHDPVVRVLAR